MLTQTDLAPNGKVTDSTENSADNEAEVDDVVSSSGTFNSIIKNATKI
jgi:hypothetical protein